MKIGRKKLPGYIVFQEKCLLCLKSYNCIVLYLQRYVLLCIIFLTKNDYLSCFCFYLGWLWLDSFRLSRTANKCTARDLKEIFKRFICINQTNVRKKLLPNRESLLWIIYIRYWKTKTYIFFWQNLK